MTGQDLPYSLTSSLQRSQSGLKSGGVVDPGQIFLFFQANFREISIFSGNFTKNVDFSRQILKNFDFSGNLNKNFDFPGKNCSFIATSGQNILFLLKSHHFRTYFHSFILETYIAPLRDTTTQRRSQPSHGQRRNTWGKCKIWKGGSSARNAARQGDHSMPMALQSKRHFLYMIRYNNISRLVHDHPQEPPATPRSPTQNLGIATPNPLRIDVSDS